MAETWVINTFIPINGIGYYRTTVIGTTYGIEQAINFTSNGESFVFIGIDGMFLPFDDGVQAYDGATWTNQAYRTVTFETAPTGDLLTWLQANAVKQEPLVTDDLTGWTWVGNDSFTAEQLDSSTTYYINFNTNNETFDQFYTSKDRPLSGSDIVYGWQVVYTIGSGWYNQAYKTIQITGGTDATNTDLIKWLQDNGTLTAPQSNITLDLSEIGLPAGTHSIQMKLSDDGVTKADSNLSNAVSYTVQPEANTVTLTNTASGGSAGTIYFECNLYEGEYDGTKEAIAVINKNETVSLHLENGLYTLLLPGIVGATILELSGDIVQTGSGANQFIVSGSGTVSFYAGARF